jgi:signal transduction histidine kinase/ligand-binding sensor domain-containing protein/AraC-like DNA-binding protein
MIKQSLLIFIFALFMCSVTYAYNLKQIADKEYMTNSSITCLCQDDKGLMWIGTCDGINIYDGRNIEEFQMQSTQDYFSGNLIDKIIYSGRDIYWMQTYYGLNKVNLRNNQITRYNEFQKLFHMSKDQDGTLYIIKDSNYIYYYHPDGTFKKISIIGIPISDIMDFFIDKNNLMWIILKGYSYCYKIKKNKETGAITLNFHKKNLSYESSLLYCFNENDAIYFIDEEYNFFYYNIDKGTKVLIYNLKNEIKLHGKISSIIKYHENFFIGFLMDGLIKLSKNQQSDQYEVQKVMIDSGVFCMQKDDFQDLMWIGTDGQGVFIYSSSPYSIKSTVLNKYKERVNRPVRALYWDDARTLWIGLKGAGILKVPNYDIHKDFNSYQTEKITTQNSALKSNAIYCFHKSHRNILWIGNEKGLNYYSYREKKIEAIDLKVEGEDFKYIHDIYETKNSDIWFSSVGMGIVKAHIGGTEDHPVLTEIQHYTINHSNFESNYFFTLYAENDSTLLFGNKGYGVFKYNIQTNGLEPFLNNNYDYMTLNNILAIGKDAQNNYLFGTSFGLIKHTSPKSYQIFNIKNGLINSTIHDMLQDSGNSFWLSTNLGLVNFNTEKDIFRSYGIKNGLEVVEFSDGGGFKDRKTGVLFFGGINGFVSIPPNMQNEKPYMPPIHFNKLSIFGEKHNLYKFIKQEKEKEVVYLKYNQNFFSLSFSSVDFFNGNNRIYYYKLKGVNEHWINNGPKDEISFTNMAPGEYTLLVKYYNSVFGKQSDIYSISIHIANPWYTSIPAYITYTICFLIASMLSIRSLVHQSKRKKQELIKEIKIKHQKEIFESKLSFFTNLAHEFCTPLTLIYGPCQRILSSKGISKFITDYVHIIQMNAERLNNLIEELIEFRRVETGYRKLKIETLNVSEICINLIKAFTDVAKSRDISLIGKAPDSIIWNTDKGLFSTIIINLISNAFKYTSNKKEIRVEIKKENDRLIVQISHEGKIDEKSLNSLFDHPDIFNNADTDTHLSKKALNLSLSYNMAKLLHGNLQVENTDNKNILFTLLLPPLEKPSEELSYTENTSNYIPKIHDQVPVQLPEYKFDKVRPSLLIIENEIEMLWFIGEILSKTYNIIPLKNVTEVNKVLNEMSPSMIIFDITNLEDAGIELIKNIKSSKETAHIPLIVISGQHEMEKQTLVLSIGAETYIPKPFDPEYLQVSIEQLLKRKEILKDYFHSPISSYEKAEGKLTHKESKVFIQSVLKIINDNITNKDLSPHYIADKLAISSRSLYRKMGEIGEVGPNDLIKECRIHVAEDLLLTTQRNIDEIVFASGFSNKVTFFKVFRKKHNCTPKQFRDLHLKEIKD